MLMLICKVFILIFSIIENFKVLITCCVIIDELSDCGLISKYFLEKKNAKFRGKKIILKKYKYIVRFAYQCT